MGHPQPLFICFRLSKQTFKFLQQINVKKCHVHSVYLWYWDSNPQPLKHESSPITTRPGLPPNSNYFTTFTALDFSPTFFSHEVRLRSISATTTSSLLETYVCLLKILLFEPHNQFYQRFCSCHNLQITDHY